MPRYAYDGSDGVAYIYINVYPLSRSLMKFSIRYLKKRIIEANALWRKWTTQNIR